MTNFEKLKADIGKMTVKEMSNFLSKCEHCFYCNVDCSGCSCDEGTIKCLKARQKKMAECYTCKNHYWIHWPQFGRKEWDSGCKKSFRCPYSRNAERCPDYERRENKNG